MICFSRLIRYFLYIYLLIPVPKLWFTQAWAQEVRDKKIIYYGWGIRDTQYIRDNWQRVEEVPFEETGLAIGINRSRPTVGDGATSNRLGWHIMGQRPFRVDDFREAIADLKIPK